MPVESTPFDSALLEKRLMAARNDAQKLVLILSALPQLHPTNPRYALDLTDAYTLLCDEGNHVAASSAAYGAGTACKGKGDLRNSLGWYRHALERAESANDPALAARALDSLGELYSSIGDYARALDAHS